MRVVGFIIAASLVLAALKAAVVVFALACIGALIVGALVRPAETLGLIVVFGGLGALQASPIATLIVVGTLCAAGWYAKRHDP